jgi:hypothetical protein
MRAAEKKNSFFFVTAGRPRLGAALAAFVAEALNQMH